MMNINIPVRAATMLALTSQPEQVLSLMAQFDQNCSGQLDFQACLHSILL